MASRAEQPSFSSGKEPLTVYMSAQRSGRNAPCVEISPLRSANFPIQGHMVNHLGCVGHTASVITIQLCCYSANRATAITNQRSRNKIDPLLTDRKAGLWGSGLVTPSTAFVMTSCSKGKAQRTWPPRSPELVIHPLIMAKERLACHGAMEAYGVGLAILKPTPEQSGHFVTIWAALPEMRVTPPLLWVGVYPFQI